MFVCFVDQNSTIDCVQDITLPEIDNDTVVIDAVLSDIEENISKIVWHRPQRCAQYNFYLTVFDSILPSPIRSHNIVLNCCESYIPTRYLHSKAEGVSYLRLIGLENGSSCEDQFIYYRFNCKFRNLKALCHY